MINHVMIYVDGNRRWGKERNLSILEVYRKAAEQTLPVIDIILSRKISYLTLYTASTDNIRNRSAQNLEALYASITECFLNLVDDCVQRGVKVIFLGNMEMVPSFVTTVFKTVEQATNQGAALTLSVLFSYGGQDEIVAATKELLHDIKNGAITCDDAFQRIDAAMLRRYMWTHDIPDPDLIIRPAGGIRRLSNGPLFQGAYSEIMFLQEYWPDINEEILERCFSAYYATPQHHGY